MMGDAIGEWAFGETARVGAGLDIGQMGELVKPADCKSAAVGIVGSSPALPTKAVGPPIAVRFTSCLLGRLAEIDLINTQRP